MGENPTHQPSFRVIPWPTAEVDAIDAIGGYAEMYWLPILHPTAYVLGRRLASLSVRARVHEGEFLELHAEAVAAAIGVLNAPSDEGEPGLATFRRALRSLCRYRLIAFRGANLEVRTRWPRLPAGLLASLPVPMQHAEPEWWALDGGTVAPDFIER